MRHDAQCERRSTGRHTCRCPSRATAASPAPDPAALLDELEALREAATPGRWVFADEIGEPGGITANVLAVDPATGLSTMWDVAACSHGGVHPDEGDQDEAARANARCIAAEHNALPRLVGAVRAVLDLADEADADSAPAYGPMWAGDLRAAVTAALAGEPQRMAPRPPAVNQEGTAVSGQGGNWHGCGYRPFAEIAAAEQRGRAEEREAWRAKVEALVEEFRPIPRFVGGYAAERIRTVVAELTAPEGGAGR